MAAVHRFSRDNARTPLQWTDGENAGFTTGTPWIPVNEDYKTFNAASEKADPDSVLNWYITLAKLRSEHEELLDGDYRELFPEHEQIFAYERENETAKAVILINLTTEPAAYDPACLEGAELLLSSAKETEKGTLAPLEAVIYEAPAGKQ
jgi:alpha-glucosidase